MRSKPIDIESALADALGYAATPLPPKFEPPLVGVRCNGGSKPNVAQDRFAVAFHCYAVTWEEAATLAAETMADVLDLDGHELGGQPCHMAESGTLPYVNPDPLRPDVPRMTFSAYLTVRSIL